MRHNPTQRGFTLLELMIAVAVVGILATVAYPAYLNQVQKARRAEAQATLLDIAGRQQQNLLDARSYRALADLGVTVPANLASHYTLTVVVGMGAIPSFTATATPINAQATDACGSLSINQLGVRAPASCW